MVDAVGVEEVDGGVVSGGGWVAGGDYVAEAGVGDAGGGLVWGVVPVEVVVEDGEVGVFVVVADAEDGVVDLGVLVAEALGGGDGVEGDGCLEGFFEVVGDGG